MSKPTRAIYMTLGSNAARNTAQIEAIPAIAQCFDQVIVTVPSWYEVPDLESHAAGEALAGIHNYGLKAIILRKLTPTWKTKMTREWRSKWFRFTYPGVFTDHGFLAAAIARVRAEAEYYNASCGLYCEPHAQPLQAWKKAALYSRMRRRIALACRRAVSVAGPVDFMLPWGSSSRTHFGWAFVDLVGVIGHILGGGTYKREDGEYRDKSNPPLGFGRVNVNPGFWTIATTTAQKIYWTARTVLEWERREWKNYKKENPTATGWWCYWSSNIGRLADLFAKEATKR